MDIHVVRPGDTLYSIAQQYGVSMARLLEDNDPPDPARLSVGQTLVVRYPRQAYRVRPGDTLWSISRTHGLTVRQLWQRNPGLGGGDAIYPGQELVLSYRQAPLGKLAAGGYAEPDIDPGLLRATLPNLSDLAPFTYGFTTQGELIPLNDTALLSAAKSVGVRPWLHLSTLTAAGTFSNQLAHAVFADGQAQNRLIADLVKTVQRKGYQGVDVDFEFILPEDAARYPEFIANLRENLAPLGIPVMVALVPKTSANQPGDFYQGHNYRLLGQAADYVFLMTYEWGYTYGPPMAVAPLNQVTRVVDYALSEIPREKIWMGMPNYGYDWKVPYQPDTVARSISNQQAIALAQKHYAAIRFDEAAQSPWFRYVDGDGQEHEVWFEDARSVRAKLELAHSRGLYGVSYWNLMRPFPQNWVLLTTLYEIED